MELINLNNKIAPASNIRNIFKKYFSFNNKKTFFIIVCIEEYIYRQENINTNNINSHILEELIKTNYPNFNNDFMISLRESFATKQNIYQALITCEKKAKKEDNVIIYFSGLSAVNNANINHFIPFGSNDFDEYISHDDLFSSINTIKCKNSLFLFDWQDLNMRIPKKDNFEENHFKNIKIEYLYYKHHFSPNIDNFSFLLIHFISNNQEKYFHRESFWFIKSNTDSIVENFEQKKLIENNQYTDPFSLLEYYLESCKYLEVAELLINSFEYDSENYQKSLEIKLKILQLQNSTLESDSIENKLEIKNELKNLLQTAKELGVTIVFLPNYQVNESMKKKRILITSANPQDTSRLRLDKEIRRINEEINKAGFRDNFEIITLTATRISDLQDALLRHSPNFVHFSGHGCPDGICLVDENDLSTVILNEPLGKLFNLFSSEIECVFLNSCYSKEQSEIIKSSIPKVIGMKESVNDNTAIEFAAAFYKAIASNKTIDFSFKFAINSIDLNELEGSDIPILLS